MLTYWFYPRLGGSSYTNPKIVLLLSVCLLLIVVSFAVSYWRKKHPNAMTRKMARSWPAALRWFGAIGLFLIISRVEDIQFFQMRFLWLLWALAAILYGGLQIWLWRKRHYTILPQARMEDPREKYLPGRG